ncbi:MAG TPA: signal peptidase I [Methylomirabilota bacterium]|jgi:signal peptidase I|nr:signal peptidase I [Methylomirabilota bacterium]
MKATNQTNATPEPQEPYWVRRPGVTVSVCLGALVVLFSLYILLAANYGNKHARIFRIGSESMEPTVHEGEDVLVQLDAYATHSPQRGDLVTFLVPNGSAISLKRVIAIGGDTISGTPDNTIVNGRELYEPYTFSARFGQGDKSSEGFPEETFGPIRIPPNCFFVMGDNREHSFDSRQPSFGCVPLDHVRGKAIQRGTWLQVALYRGQRIQ